MNHKLKTIDGETLMNTVLPSIDFVVDNFLSQGLHLLAGASKVGKSWLALWLALSIAKGEEVWNRKVKQGTTLYLCLEDNDVRIQSRLFDITDDAPNSVHFTMKASTIGNGLEEELEQFIVDHPDTVLIIIDTLQMVRNSSGDNSYSSDYRDLSILKKLADKHKIAILLIHHLRKEDAETTFEKYATIWLERQTHYKLSTLVGYQRYLEICYEFIGHIPLNKIRPITMENLCNELRKRIFRGKLISEQTVQKYLGAVSVVLADAKRNEIISKTQRGRADGCDVRCVFDPR